MASQPQLIKQIACGRRKPGMTRKEYFDHRFRIHGRITDVPDQPDLKPYKYTQTQVFDSAYGPRAGGPFNANHAWFGRDDVTELYFRDWQHVKSCFASEYLEKTVKPDAALFADFETAISLMAYEIDVPLKTDLGKDASTILSASAPCTTALLFISAPSNTMEGEELEGTLSPLLVAAIEKEASSEVRKLVANVGITSSQFDLSAYFGGGGMPHFALVYKLFLKDTASVTAVRRAQRAFEDSASGMIDMNNRFILFGHQALVMDQGKNIRFDPDRQPRFSDLPGPSHLDTA